MTILKEKIENGVISFSSPWSFNETIKKIEAELHVKKIKLFSRINQSEEKEYL